MPASTRKLFIDYERDEVGRRARGQPAQIKREWDAKSPAERAAWVDAYNETELAKVAVTHRRRVVNRDRITVNTERTAIQGRQRPARHVYTGFFQRTKDVIQQCKLLQTCYQRLETAWTQLRNLENGQPLPNHQSLAHAAFKTAWALNRKTHVDTMMARLNGFLIRPPVPQDPVNGEARMPEEWLPGRDIRALNHLREDADEADGNVGLPGAGAGTWIAKDRMGGGQSRGTVWLHFDNHNTLNDVSDLRLFQDHV